MQVLGLTSVPGAGDSFLVVAEDRIARQIAATRQARERNAQLAKSRPRRTLEEFLSQVENGRAQPSLESLTRIARALGTTPQSLFAGPAASVPTADATLAVVRAGDPAGLGAGNRGAAGRLGWRPRRSLADAVADAWEWMRAHPAGYPED